MDEDQDKAEIGATGPDYYDERQPILGPKRRAETEVFTRRWYILFVFCFTSFNGALLWNAWGPITESAEAVFGWDDGNIGMLSNYGNIFMIFVLPMCWFMDVKGLRWATLIASLVNFVGAGIRCISMNTSVITWTANICSAFSGISGCVCYAGPSLVSSVWFPPNQRATATAAMSLSSYFGVGMSFIIGPYMVRGPLSTNHTDPDNEQVFITDFTDTTETNITNIPEVKKDIRNLMYLHWGLCILCFLLNLIYFPAKPPTPPSISASVKRTDYIEGLRQLLCMRSVWLVVLAYSFPVGILQVWATVLAVNLKPVGIGQKTAGYMGFWHTMAGCAGGIIISRSHIIMEGAMFTADRLENSIDTILQRCSDIFMRHIKLILIVLFLGATVTSAWLTVLCENFIPLNIPSLYIACIFVGIFVNGSIPLFYEITCEASYPVAEGVTVGWITLVSQLLGTCFLFILLDESLGTSWMNWVLFGSIVLALPLLCAFREKYRRMDVDITMAC